MKSISDLTGKMYENEDVVFFRNHVQAAHYYAWGCELVDQFVDGNMKWVFVFKKSVFSPLSFSFIFLPCKFYNVHNVRQAYITHK